MSDESDRLWQQQYVRVLREVTAGDMLGPRQDHDAAPPTRTFELSGNLYPARLFDRMIAEKLLVVDDERGVIETSAGSRYLFRYR